MFQLCRPATLAAAAAAALAALPATAAISNANPSNLAAVFAAALPGDTIVVTGNFGATTLANRSFAVPVTIDARGATFSDSLLIHDVTGLAFTGGYYGSTTHVARLFANVAGGADTNISFDGGYFVGPGGGSGIGIGGSTGITVTNSVFDGLHAGVALGNVTGALLDRNRSIHSASDGFDIAGSHNVTVRGSQCSAGAPSAAAHPDCVQLYSIQGLPVQSDITIVGNTALGPTQGFTSFTSRNGGGLRIDISDNTVATSFPQGIACYGCSDSSFTFNTLTTLPGARFRTNINIIGGTDNVIFGNTRDGEAAPDDPNPFADEDLPTEVSTVLGWNAQTFVNDLTSATFGEQPDVVRVAAVPEPTTWALFVAGIGLVGGTIRRQRSAVVAA